MTAKPVVLRGRAVLDAEEAVAYYVREAGEKVALDFVDALERAYRQIALHPTSGSLRFAHELDLPGLRHRPLRRFPYLVFYVDLKDQIDVWRVLHGARDIPEWLRDEGA
ncbi:MAG: type II toxin-antitoxin system RelE/ParE family toxin [Alphaproteobacteria bacterium]|nr:type II toxin-antitoxin system RelE/ParE family toxin [Alphaproteobacteria bacterium]